MAKKITDVKDPRAEAKKAARAAKKAALAAIVKDEAPVLGTVQDDGTVTKTPTADETPTESVVRTGTVARLGLLVGKVLEADGSPVPWDVLCGTVPDGQPDALWNHQYDRLKTVKDVSEALGDLGFTIPQIEISKKSGAQLVKDGAVPSTLKTAEKGTTIGSRRKAIEAIRFQLGTFGDKTTAMAVIEVLREQVLAEIHAEQAALVEALD